TDPTPTSIYPLSLHDALPIYDRTRQFVGQEINANHLRPVPEGSTVTGTARPVHIGRSSQVWNIEIRNERGQLVCVSRLTMAAVPDRKSTRLNSSHVKISYAVF